MSTKELGHSELYAQVFGLSNSALIRLQTSQCVLARQSIISMIAFERRSVPIRFTVVAKPRALASFAPLLITAKPQSLSAFSFLCSLSLFPCFPALGLPLELEQTIKHSPNGRLLAVCGDGEFIIYTAIALKNQSFGSVRSACVGNGLWIELHCLAGEFTEFAFCQL